MIAVRHLRSLFIWRLWISVKHIMKGVRIHPSALLNGDGSSFKLDKGTKVGAHCKLDNKSLGVIGSGNDVWISSDVEMETTTAIHVGEGTTIQRRCTINGSVRVGNGCIFAPNVFVSSGTHPFRENPHLPIRVQEQEIVSKRGSLAHLDKPIWIQDDCWLGVNAVVCPGVTVGKGSVVGANAVVTKNVAPYSIVAGAPAKVIGRRFEWEPKTSLNGNCEEDAPYILSGLRRPARDGIPGGIQITNEVPFCAVLRTADSSSKVLIKYFATQDAEVVVDNKLFSVNAGRGQLEACIKPNGCGSELVFCEVIITSKKNVDCFVVENIFCAS